MIRTYRRLCRIPDHMGRFNYLKLNSQIGVATFGSSRYLNQQFYTSAQWHQVRNEVIARDLGCDLGLEGYEIYDQVDVHHMNPMTADQLAAGDDCVLDPQFLITVSHRTHNAIHFGDASLLATPFFAERRPGDTTLW